jgi:hypothetical protein
MRFELRQSRRVTFLKAGLPEVVLDLPVKCRFQNLLT